MIEWILGGLLLMIFILVMGRSLITESRVSTKEKILKKQETRSPAPDIIEPAMKERVCKAEADVIRNAEMVRKIADHETEVIELGLSPLAAAPAAPAPSVNGSLEDTAILRSISKKVEEVEKLSKEEEAQAP